MNSGNTHAEPGETRFLFGMTRDAVERPLLESQHVHPWLWLPVPSELEYLTCSDKVW